MQLLDKTAEERLMGLLKSAKHDINGGTSPTEAIFKVAQANSLTPPFVQRMVEAVNTALQLEHLKLASDRRAESFPLANAEDIIAKMYPDEIISPATKAAAVYAPACYDKKETTNFNVKVAKLTGVRADYGIKPPEPYAPDPLEKSSSVICRYNLLNKQAEEAVSYAKGRHEDLVRGIHKVAEYFSNSYHTPFAEVEERVFAQHGENGKLIMDLVHDVCRVKEKRAVLKEQLVRAYPESQDPFHAISDLVNKAAHIGECGNGIVSAELAARAFARQHNMTDKFAHLYEDAPANKNSDDLTEITVPFEKAAIDPATIALVGGMNLMGLKEPSDSLRRDASLAASDPTHESELQSIKVKSMLNDMVSNDPVLSGHDPHEVFNAYNSLASMSPHAAQQPALMRGALRRMLQQEGVMEPFEAHQMGQIERGLRGLQPAVEGKM